MKKEVLTAERFSSTLWFTDGKNVRAWDLKEDRIVKTIPMKNLVLDLAVSPEGKDIAICEDIYIGGKVIVLDAETLKQKYETVGDNFTGVAFSPNGDVLAAWGYRKASILTTQTGKEVGSITPSMGCDHAVFSPDGWTLAVVSTGPDDHATLILWDLVKNTEVRVGGFEYATRNAIFSPDGKVIASRDRNLQFRDAVTGRLLWIYDGFVPGLNLVYSPGGEFLATSSGRVYETEVVMRNSRTP
jgi:WD40 repeat protein